VDEDGHRGGSYPKWVSEPNRRHDAMADELRIRLSKLLGKAQVEDDADFLNML
jgi:hypothetical protein